MHTSNMLSACVIVNVCRMMIEWTSFYSRLTRLSAGVKARLANLTLRNFNFTGDIKLTFVIGLIKEDQQSDHLWLCLLLNMHSCKVLLIPTRHQVTSSRSIVQKRVTVNRCCLCRRIPRSIVAAADQVDQLYPWEIANPYF